MVEFGPFRLDIDIRRLLCRGEEVRLGNRSMELLVTLVRRKGEVVSKSELLQAARPGIFIEQGNLKVTIASLRQKLRRHSGSDAYIKTFSNRGYWFSDEADDYEPRSNERNFSSDALVPNVGLVIGRDDEVAALVADLGTSRLTTVVGAGGIGKTTIAVAAAELIAQKSGVQVIFVDLSKVEGEEYVLPSLAAMLGVTSGRRDRLDAIASVLVTARRCWSSTPVSMSLMPPPTSVMS